MEDSQQKPEPIKVPGLSMFKTGTMFHPPVHLDRGPQMRRIAYISGIVLVILVLLAIAGRQYLIDAYAAYDLTGAQRAFNQNDVDGALAQVDRILGYDPKSIGAWVNKSIFLAQKGSLENKESEFGPLAADAATHATKLNPKSSEAWRALGYAYEIQQAYPLAHQSYQKALALNPKNALALFGDAHSYDLEGDMTQAEKGYRAALAIDPRYAKAHAGLARVLNSKQDIDGALAELMKAYQLETNTHNKAEDAFSIGMLKNTQKDFTGAEAYLLEATKLDPKYAEAWNGLGIVAFYKLLLTAGTVTAEERGGLMRFAISATNAAIRLNPNFAGAYLQLAIEQSAIGQIDAALTLLDKAQQTVSKDITLNAPAKTDMLLRIESQRKLITALKSAYAKKPSTP